jgi:hypothetical protein
VKIEVHERSVRAVSVRRLEKGGGGLSALLCAIADRLLGGVETARCSLVRSGLGNTVQMLGI